MKSNSAHVAWTPRFAAAFYFVMFGVGGGVFTGESRSSDDLPAMCRTAKTAFRPPTTADLQSVKVELGEAAARLDRRLSADGQNGEDWRKYLLWSEMQKELAGQQPDTAVLSKVYAKYLAGHEGLGLVWLLEVRHALQHYLEIAAAIENPKIKAEYEQLMDGLAHRLETYAAKSSPDDALVIGDALRWLEDLNEAPQVVTAVRERFVHPNGFFEVSADVVNRGIADRVDDTRQVRDCILDTDIYATAHTTGQTSVQLVSSEHCGVVDTILLGVTNSQNVGYHGPVEIFSCATTRFSACKRLWVDAEGLYSAPAVSNAVNEATITDIRSLKGRRLLEKMAWKRAGKKQGQAEWIAARHAEYRVNEQMDQQAGEMLGRANQSFQTKFRKPLLQHKLFPQQLVFSTTQPALQALSLAADCSQLGAPTAPPELTGQRDLAVRIHESMVNNVAGSALGGMTLREATFQAGVVDLLGELPERLKPDDDREPWAITFARLKPIFVSFADDQIKILLRGHRYFKGDESYPGMDVSAVYKIVKTPEGFNAVRQGPLEIFPPGFVPGGAQKLTSREIVIRKLLERRFSKIFDEELVGRGFTFPGTWRKVGKMRPVQMTSQDGWLTIAWQREASETSTADKQPPANGSLADLR